MGNRYKTADERCYSMAAVTRTCEIGGRIMGKVKDLTGQKFGRLTVIKQNGFSDRNKYGGRYAKWLCKCDCGNYCERTTDILKRVRSVHSCGCISQEHLHEMAKANITHGMTGSRLYGCYKNMMSRCYRTKDIHYKAYGQRGIVVCKEWKRNPSAFIDWALSNGYSDELTIERINVNGNYEPSNCTWIPMKEQYKNKQSNCYRKLPEPYEGVGE
jgi:hypothetical protein